MFTPNFIPNVSTFHDLVIEICILAYWRSNLETSPKNSSIHHHEMFISMPELNIRLLNYCSAGEAHARYFFIKRLTEKRQEVRRGRSKRERKPMMLPRSPRPLNSLGLWSDGRISSVLSVSPFSFLRLHRAAPHPRLVQLPHPFLFFSEPKILIVPTVIYQSGTLFFNRQKKRRRRSL